MVALESQLDSLVQSHELEANDVLKQEQTPHDTVIDLTIEKMLDDVVPTALGQIEPFALDTMGSMSATGDVFSLDSPNNFQDKNSLCCATPATNKYVPQNISPVRSHETDSLPSAGTLRSAGSIHRRFSRHDCGSDFGTVRLVEHVHGKQHKIYNLAVPATKSQLSVSAACLLNRNPQPEPESELLAKQTGRHSQPGREAGPGSASEQESEQKLKQRLKLNSEQMPKPQMEPVLRSEYDFEPVPEPELQLKLNTEQKPQPDSEQEPKQKPVPKMEPGLRAEQYLEPVPESELQLKLNIEQKPQPDPEEEPKQMPEPKLDPGLGPEQDLEPVSESEQELKLEFELKPEVELETGLKLKPELGRECNLHLVPQPELELKLKLEQQPAPQEKPGLELGSMPKQKLESLNPEVELWTETEREQALELQRESELDLELELEPKPATVPKLVVETAVPQQQRRQSKMHLQLQQQQHDVVPMPNASQRAKMPSWQHVTYAVLFAIGLFTTLLYATTWPAGTDSMPSEKKRVA
eukprot:g768.t1